MLNRSRALRAASLLAPALMGISPSASADVVTVTTIYSFSGVDGRIFAGPMTLGNDGNLYGTTRYGGANQDGGTVFKITPDGTLTTLYSFPGDPIADGIDTDGAQPWGRLFKAPDGSFYGTTTRGGGGGCSDGTDAGCGVVFKITPAGDYTMVYAFTGLEDGFHPASILLATDGNLYGVVNAHPYPASAFKLTPAGDRTTLFTFPDADTTFPGVGLVEGSDGRFYGTTASDGQFDAGTIFALSKGGVHQTLYEFGPLAGSPSGTMTRGTDGDIYGVTPFGGGSGAEGTAFKISVSGQYTFLHGFSQTPPSGFSPSGDLVQAPDGNFYGVTGLGGANGSCTRNGGCGALYRMTPSGTVTTIHSFTGCNGELEAKTALTVGSDGALYGATGGTTGCNGKIFKVTITPDPPPPPASGGGGESGGGGGGALGATACLMLAMLAVLRRFATRRQPAM